MKPTIIKGIAAAILLLPFAVSATPISGTIGLGGAMELTCDVASEGAAGAEPCSIENATGVSFLNDGTGTVDSAEGDFASFINVGDTAMLNDFGFDPLSLNNPLWSVGGFSFDISTLSSFDVITTPSGASFLLLSGTGVIYFGADATARNGALDPTEGIWSFSADSTSPNGVFSWSSTAAPAPAPAPEPGILMLLGIGLIGSFGVRRLSRT